MGFKDVLEKYNNNDLELILKNTTKEDVLRVLEKESLKEDDFLRLLSPTANLLLEKMAIKAQKLTLQHFGKAILLYTPLYLSNYCVNQCSYCGFNTQNKITRKKLTLEEVESEAKIISKTGLKHILILTGESRSQSPVSYIKDCVKVLKKYFSSISIEIYPLDTNEYAELIESGVDSLTIYQEVYDVEVYKSVHLSGPKSDYNYRLDAPERACMANIRSVGIGPLLGLTNWQIGSFFAGLHANYLQNKFSHAEISISFPRLRPQTGGFESLDHVTDRQFVQIILALRMFLPRCGITLSTRETSRFRDNLIGLGVTKISAGSVTEVGGHSSNGESESQFEISDERSVDEIKNMLYEKGYQPVFKDWQFI